MKPRGTTSLLQIIIICHGMEVCYIYINNWKECRRQEKVSSILSKPDIKQGKSHIFLNIRCFHLIDCLWKTKWHWYTTAMWIAVACACTFKNSVVGNCRWTTFLNTSLQDTYTCTGVSYRPLLLLSPIRPVNNSRWCCSHFFYLILMLSGIIRLLSLQTFFNTFI